MANTAKFWFFEKPQYKVREGKKGLREVYDLLAADYDDSRYLSCTRWIEREEEMIVNRWLNDFSSPVIDVGCGTGRYAVKIARMGMYVIALDLSIGMLKKAKKKGGDRVLPVLADAECLPLKEDSCRGIICTLTFDHLFDFSSAVYEFRRVLKKTGICIISTFNEAFLKKFRRKLGLPCAYMPFRTEKCGPTLIYEVGHTERELRRLFKGGGFRIKTTELCPFLLGRLFGSFSLFRRLAPLFVFKLRLSGETEKV
jgi:ubiquinone/menaquinone biosynthesis C-methylase UbiE